jgi:hypothetical protein
MPNGYVNGSVQGATTCRSRLHTFSLASAVLVCYPYRIK